ncbi:HlyD family type I secretion periplasmic adaptor subunit [Pseudomonas massiliensis]|uniref:HlyD family type I secretion periplasmic adaptor subunit n=1 Tax=Pseudomonas massiliensis TaxID=522492 RepID=UPI00058B3F5D|nr:HlyD family type I secretion periplasmic adaptor subunit [Pseudomonas massiliensis]
MMRWRAMARRYAAAVRVAWARRQPERHDRPPAEWAFMAPALALQQRPPQVFPRLLQGLILAVLLFALIWSVVGKVDVVATASGKVVPSGRSKVVQPKESAVIKAIHVQDGQPVAAGEVLVELEARATAADLARLRTDLLSARMDAARAVAMIASVETDQPPQLPDDRVAGVSTLKRQAVQRWLEGQYLELRSQLDQAAAEIARAEHELGSLDVSIAALRLSLPIARELVEDYAQLLAENAVAKHQYLQRKQEQLQQQRELEQLRARRQEVTSALQAAVHRRSIILAQQRRNMLDLQHEAESRANTLEHELEKARLRHGQRTLRAPVDGTVQQLAVHTVGGVVTEAQPLMVIVPKEQPIEVEAFLANKDVGFVEPGQSAQIKVETFSYTRYGLAQGVVSSVSHDAIEDAQRGLVYAVRIRLDSPWLTCPGAAPLLLTPGMAVTAEITTRQRRLISYFLTPLEVMTRESLRER